MASYDIYVNDEHAFRLYVVEQFGKIDSRLSRVEEHYESLASDMKDLRADVKDLQADVKNLQAEAKGLRSDVQSVRADVKHVNDEQIALNARLDMLLWGAGIIIGAATLAVTIWSLFKPSRNEESPKPQPVPAPSPAPAPTVINIPQIDINALFRQVSDILSSQPKP